MGQPVMIRLPRVKFNTSEASLIPGVLPAMDILLAILPSTTSHGAPTRVLSSYLTIALVTHWCKLRAKQRKGTLFLLHPTGMEIASARVNF